MISAGSSHSDRCATRSPLRSLLVEPVSANNVDELVALFAANRVPAVTATFDPFELTDEEARRIALEPRRDEYFVARGPTGLVAMSMLRGFDEGFEIPSFGIFVDRRRQGRGIGSWLTQWTIGWSDDHGHPAIRLSVYAGNPRAIGLYRSLGFTEVQRVPTRRAGKPDEKVIMMLKLRGRA